MGHLADQTLTYLRLSSGPLIRALFYFLGRLLPMLPISWTCRFLMCLGIFLVAPVSCVPCRLLLYIKEEADRRAAINAADVLLTGQTQSKCPFFPKFLKPSLFIDHVLQ